MWTVEFTQKATLQSSHGDTEGNLGKTCQQPGHTQPSVAAARRRAHQHAGDVDRSSGQLRMVVDNPLHAAGTLREQHYKVEERDVLSTAMPNEPGALGRALKLLAEAGINVEYAYASGIDRLPMVAVVIGVDDAQRASYTPACDEPEAKLRIMRLFVPTMDTFLVEFDADGRVRFDNEEWTTPSVQERRAIIHAATDQLEQMKELLDVLEREP